MNLRVHLHAVQPATVARLGVAAARLARTPATAARTSVRSAIYHPRLCCAFTRVSNAPPSPNPHHHPPPPYINPHTYRNEGAAAVTAVAAGSAEEEHPSIVPGAPPLSWQCPLQMLIHQLIRGLLFFRPMPWRGLWLIRQLLRRTLPLLV